VAEPRHKKYRPLAATRVTPESWAAVRTAVKDVGDRFADLVLSAPDPDAMATADWTIMDTAAHVTVIAWNYTAQVVSADTPVPVPVAGEILRTTTVYNIHGGFNAAMMHGYPERDRREVTWRLGASIDELLALTATIDPGQPVTWLGDSRLPVAGVFAHLLNEMLVHGRDIARSIGTPWAIADEYAAMFIELFMVEICRHGTGVVLSDGKPPRPGRIAVEFRSAFTRPVTIVLDNGVVTAEEPGRDNDVRLYFKPATQSLGLFHRVGRPRAAMTGELRIWGRRPWRLAHFLRKVRMP
jgi:hypothetical protein